MATIVFQSGDLGGNELELTEKILVFGRMTDCGVVLDDPAVSSRHAELRQVDDHWQLVDLRSSNGTLVNGATIDQARLRHGDVIEIGGTRMQFLVRADGAAAAPSASAAGEEPVRAASVTIPAASGGAASVADVELVEQMRQRTDSIRREVAKGIVGQTEVLDQVLMTMIAGGHALVVGLPGLAKTLMVRTIAQVLDLNFKRIQFTPDLMPTDITGTEVLESNRDTGEREFRFIKGPLFCNLLLADEINRTPPKTQAALLEAMQEHRVTAGNVTYRLEEPFFVLATQNPIEQEGTYPLPEAQLDRFMFNIWIDYPQEQEEELIVGSTTTGREIRANPVLTKQEVLQLQEVVRKIPLSEHVTKYAVRLVRNSRPKEPKAPDFIQEYVSTGAGPRAGQYLILAAKARAVLEGRIHVSCKDIQAAAVPVLRHRIYTNFAADSEGLTSMDLIKRLLEAVPQPSEKDYA